MCVGFLYTLCPNDPSSCSINNTSKKEIVLSSFCISNLNLIEACKLLMCSRSRWRFSRPCAQLLNIFEFIHILKADKGYATVVLDLVEYDNKILVLLNTSTYRERKSDPTARIERKVCLKLSDLKKAEILSQNVFDAI